MLRVKPLRKSLSAIIPPALMLVGALLLLARPLFPAQAQDLRADRKLLQSAVLSVDPASADVDVGDTTTVDIYITDVTDLAYVEMYVLFDPDLLEVVDADSGTSGVQIEIGSFLGAGVIVDHNEVDQDIGEIHFSQEVASDGVSGDGVLATITFEGIAPGPSDITIDEMDLYLDDGDGDPIDVSVENGSITVAGDVTSSPTPEVTSTLTSTLAATATSKVTSTPTRTPTPGPTATFAPTATSAPTSEPTVRPTATSEIKTRVLQVWPDRSVGVASGLLEGTTSYANAHVLPFGILSPSASELVEARTYLHFPLGVFPLGTQVKRAILYVYVDSVSGPGETAFGTYRVLDPWDTTGWEGNPADWPALLLAPIAVTEVDFAAEEALLPASTAPKLAMILSQDSPLPTPTSGSSVLPTPTPTATSAATSAATSPATSSPAPTSTARPSSTPVPGSSPPPVFASTFELEATEGRWLMWDVTALLRAWLAQEIPDHGLALAAAVDSGPGSADELIAARRLAVDDPDTQPYIVADIAIYPVTPTPTPTTAPILPIAGDSGGGSGIGVMTVGAALLILGLALAAWRGRFRDQA
jgi:hypothetical protein